LAIALEGNDFLKYFVYATKKILKKYIFKIVIPPEGNEKNK
jgi:hypothetical protein